MNLVYTIDRTARLVRLHYAGGPTFEEWAATMESALADPAFRPGFAVLLDRRGVSHTPTTETIKRAAEFFTLRRKLLEGCRMAAVVEAGSVYGMGRMLEAVSEGGPVTFRVFTAYEEASHWLGVSA